MNTKKKDNKGRNLRQGERQREDGRYEFRYKDVKGETRSIYSWKLVETDSLPAGKRCEKSLREMEKAVLRDVDDDINRYAAYRTTLNSFFDSYIQSKYEIKHSTRANYKYMYKKYVHDELGQMNIGSIRYSHVKNFYIHLINDVGFKPNSMEIIHTILHPIFNVAVRDGLIRLNPTDGVMNEIKRSHDWEKPKRHALTEAQQEAFVSYVAGHKTYQHWLPLFTVLLGTGCRVGEVIGLRWEDCDFKDEIISINHNLIYRQGEDGGDCRFRITTPKTKAGVRIVPMLSEVKQALLEARLSQMRHGFNQSVVDGYSGFIFQNRFGDCISPHCINRAIERISRDYNAAESACAEEEHREPVLLPHFTVHNLRHPYVKPTTKKFCLFSKKIRRSSALGPPVPGIYAQQAGGPFVFVGL